MRITNHTVLIDHASSIEGVNFSNKTISFKEDDGPWITIPFRTVLRLIAVADTDCKMNEISYEEFVKSCMKD